MQLGGAVHAHDERHGDVGGAAGAADDDGVGGRAPAVEARLALEGEPGLQVGDDAGSLQDGDVDGREERGGAGPARPARQDQAAGGGEGGIGPGDADLGVGPGLIGAEQPGLERFLQAGQGDVIEVPGEHQALAEQPGDDIKGLLGGGGLVELAGQLLGAGEEAAEQRAGRSIPQGDDGKGRSLRIDPGEGLLGRAKARQDAFSAGGHDSLPRREAHC
jgi:hypothetical protein